MWNKERGYPILINFNTPATKADLQAMRTISHLTRKGWDTTGWQPYPMVQPADVMINLEALNHTLEPKLFLEDVFQRHPQFRVWYDQLGGDILKANYGELILPAISITSWEIPQTSERGRSGPSDCPREGFAEDRLPHVQMAGEEPAVTRRPLNWSELHPPDISLLIANAYEQGSIFDGHTHQVPEKDIGPFELKGENVWPCPGNLHYDGVTCKRVRPSIPVEEAIRTSGPGDIRFPQSISQLLLKHEDCTEWPKVWPKDWSRRTYVQTSQGALQDRILIPWNVS